jgi:hypothetical protein
VPALPILPGSSYLRGAHHPHCSRHGAHLLWVFGRPLCLGCTCVALGLCAGVVATFFISRSSTALAAWLVLHSLLVAPTAFQPWLQWKPFKIFARTLLGVASATWLIGPVVQPHTLLGRPGETGLAVLAFAIVARLLLGVRESNTVSPCTACPLGAYPTCSWNLPRLLNEIDDRELAHALADAIGTGGVVQLRGSQELARRSGER